MKNGEVTIHCTANVDHGSENTITAEQMLRIADSAPRKVVYDIKLQENVSGRRQILTFTVTAPPATARSAINGIARIIPGVPILWGSPPASYFFDDFAPPPPPSSPRSCGCFPGRLLPWTRRL